MPLDLRSLVAPAHTALVTQECQRGVIGDLSALPALAEAAKGEMIANVAALVDAARRAGVRVIHCTAERRPDGRGANANARIFQYMARAKVGLHPGSPAAELVPEIGVAASDLVLARLHGLSPFSGTELDFVDSAGVGAFVGLYKAARACGTRLRFAGARPGVGSVLELIRLQAVAIRQSELFADIELRKHHGFAAAVADMTHAPPEDYR